MTSQQESAAAPSPQGFTPRMRIALISHAFSPSIGGVESVAAALAGGLSAAGHGVTVITRTPAATDPGSRSSVDLRDPLPYRVLRRPGWRALTQQIRQADVVLHNNPTLRYIWPSILLRRPTLLSHHTWLPERKGVAGAKAGLKRWVCAQFATVAVSHVLADSLPGDVHVIPNGYDDTIFHPGPPEDRRPAILFVGRLVSDKGCNLLLAAFDEAIRRFGLPSTIPLLIVGDGPELASLKDFAHRSKLAERVSFLGSKSPRQVADLMRRHSVVVAPSLWREPFGLVALEAAASGALAVVPQDTGLTEAAGPAAIGFERGNPDSLARSLVEALGRVPDDQALETHARSLRSSNQIRAYETVLAEMAFGIVDHR